MTPDSFSEYYKTITNTGLLEILDHPENYLPLAVQAARQEWESRSLSDEELADARAPVIEEQARKEERLKKIKAIENSLRDKGVQLVMTLNPVQTEKPSTEKVIRAISIILLCFFLLQVLGNFRMLVRMAKYLPGFDWSTLLFYFPLVVLLITTITFWKRKRAGWMLLVFYLIYLSAESLYGFTESIKRYNSDLERRLFARPSPFSLVIMTVFSLVNLFVILRPSIRAEFRIDKPRLIATLFMSCLVTVFLMVES